MKLAVPEQKVVDLIRSMPGGSICAGADTVMTTDARRVFRALERKGVLTSEPTDDGDRYTLTTWGRADAS